MDRVETRRLTNDSENVCVAEMETVGGSLVAFAPDGSDGPYAVFGVYDGPGTGFHYIATHKTYIGCLTAMVEKITATIETECAG